MTSLLALATSIFDLRLCNEDCKWKELCDPAFCRPHHCKSGYGFFFARQYDDAIDQLRKTLELDPGYVPALTVLGSAYVQKSMCQEGMVRDMTMAIIYTGLGQTEQALQWLEKSYQERSIASYMIQVTPVFDTLRSDPRFADLLRRMGLPQ